MKAILILDEKPFCCDICRLSIAKKGGLGCIGTRKEGGGLMVNEVFGTIPNWCPLIEINDNIAKLIEVAR